MSSPLGSEWTQRRRRAGLEAQHYSSARHWASLHEETRDTDFPLDLRSASVFRETAREKRDLPGFSPRIDPGPQLFVREGNKTARVRINAVGIKGPTKKGKRSCAGPACFGWQRDGNGVSSKFKRTTASDHQPVYVLLLYARFWVIYSYRHPTPRLCPSVWTASRGSQTKRYFEYQEKKTSSVLVLNEGKGNDEK